MRDDWYLAHIQNSPHHTNVVVVKNTRIYAAKSIVRPVAEPNILAWKQLQPRIDILCSIPTGKKARSRPDPSTGKSLGYCEFDKLSKGLYSPDG